MIYAEIIKRGLQNGINVTYELAKAIIPVYFFIKILERSGLLEVIAKWFAPFMSLMGLPGEASLILVIGNALTLYPTIGAIQALDLSAKQITIIATMLLLSHSLFLESAVIKKTGSNALRLTLVRIIVAVMAGITLNIFW